MRAQGCPVVQSTVSSFSLLEFFLSKSAMHENGIRSFLGIKYYSITGRTDQKDPYNQKAALDPDGIMNPGKVVEPIPNARS